MTAFNVDGGRSFPHLPTIKLSTERANTSGLDYGTVAQLAAGAPSDAFIIFDTQYLAWGGANQQDARLGLNVVPGTLQSLGRSVEVVAQITGVPGQLEFLMTDFEPQPLTFAQLTANCIADTDRPPVAVANDATTFKVVQYTARTRFVYVRMRNLGGIATTSWYLSLAVRQD